MSTWLFGVTAAAYTAIYAVCAASPEIQPDATTYHLGLAAEYVRLGRFPARVGFYEILPQGLEMLFVEAFSFGSHIAAKLVHFAFFLGTVPLMLVTGRRLGLSDSCALGAALLYACMPVAGITGTSAYNDAALVFFMVLAFYLFLLWEAEKRARYLLAAGIAAGFCYSIKITGLPVAAALTLAAIAAGGSPRPGFIAAAGAAVSIAPWMARALLVTGNPAAPFLNRWFPNPYFNTTTEQLLSEMVRSYGNFHWKTAPAEYAFRGGMQGVTGPILLFLPLAVFAVRSKAGRQLLTAAAVAVMPWFWNAGTRFLMPAVPFAALAFASVAPRRLLYIAVLAQAILCWPSVIERFEDPYRWSIHEIPWRAALHMESEDAYLRRVVGDYPVALMVEEHTDPRDRIFCLSSTARAYTTRELVDYWHSTPLQQLSDALNTAYLRTPMVVASAEWPSKRYRAIRVSAVSNAASEWRIFELRIFSPGERVYPTQAWSLNASPNRWEAPWSVDENRSTGWRTRDNVHASMFLEADLGPPVALSGIAVFEAESSASLPLIVDGQEPDGKWSHVADSLKTNPTATGDLRREAIRALRRAGFRYVLAEAGSEGMGLIGSDMSRNPADWGVRDAAETTPFHLFRIL